MQNGNVMKLQQLDFYLFLISSKVDMQVKIIFKLWNGYWRFCLFLISLNLFWSFSYWGMFKQDLLHLHFILQLA